MGLKANYQFNQINLPRTDIKDEFNQVFNLSYVGPQTITLISAIGRRYYISKLLCILSLGSFTVAFSDDNPKFSFTSNTTNQEYNFEELLTFNNRIIFSFTGMPAGAAWTATISLNGYSEE